MAPNNLKYFSNPFKKDIVELIYRQKRTNGNPMDANVIIEFEGLLDPNIVKERIRKMNKDKIVTTWCDAEIQYTFEENQDSLEDIMNFNLNIPMKNDNLPICFHHINSNERSVLVFRLGHEISDGFLGQVLIDYLFDESLKGTLNELIQKTLRKVDPKLRIKGTLASIPDSLRFLIKKTKSVPSISNKKIRWIQIDPIPSAVWKEDGQSRNDTFMYIVNRIMERYEGSKEKRYALLVKSVRKNLNIEKRNRTSYGIVEIDNSSPEKQRRSIKRNTRKCMVNLIDQDKLMLLIETVGGIDRACDISDNVVNKVSSINSMLPGMINDAKVSGVGIKHVYCGATGSRTVIFTCMIHRDQMMVGACWFEEFYDSDRLDTDIRETFREYVQAKT